jgi:hypothetical protein
MINAPSIRKGTIAGRKPDPRSINFVGVLNVDCMTAYLSARDWDERWS